MAYIDDPYKKQQEDQTQNQGLANSGGNIYSTSQSEVSTVSNGSSGSNSSNESNKSGNWVNLNKYLDANQGKVGGYIDNLVQPYKSSSDQFKENMQASNDNYREQVASNTVTSDRAKDIITRYGKDGTSITDDEYSIVSNALNDKFGVDDYKTTDDYTKLNKTANDIGKVANNLSNSNYQQSLMGNQVSSGGKKLNSFLIGGTQEGRQKVTDYSKQFSELSKLLDNQSQELNNVRDQAFEQSKAETQPVLDYYSTNKAPLQEVWADEINSLRQNYGANPVKFNTDNFIYFGNNYLAPYDSKTGITTNYNPKTPDTITLPDGSVITLKSISRSQNKGSPYADGDFVQDEYAEYNDRINSLLTGSGRVNSKVDNLYDTYSDDEWTAIQDRSNQLGGIIQNPKSKVERDISSLFRNNLSNNSFVPYSVKTALQDIYSSYLRGEYNNYNNPLEYLREDLIKASGGY